MRDSVQVQVVLFSGMENLKSLTIRLKHTILDAIMHHFDKMASGSWTTVEVAIGGGKGFQEWFDVIKGRLFATDHEAVSYLEAPDTTAGTSVHELEAPGGKFLAASDGIVEVRVASIDNNVSFGKQRSNLVDHVIGSLTGRYHGPDNTRSLQFLDKLGEAVGTFRAF